MRISLLLKDIFSVPAQADLEISGLQLDSRKIQPNDVFIAFKGAHYDGYQYISNAIAKGATAVLIEGDENAQLIFQDAVPIVPIQHLQKKLGLIAARFYAHPARKMRLIGVTGTSGKTSCTQFIAQCLQNLQVPCGIIGTLGTGFYGALNETGFTTPDAITLQACLRDLVMQNAQAVAMEVSSHSIDQERIGGIEFDIGIFTNLSQDHLDYHGDMETYAAVKYRFLAELPTKQVIVNADDARGKQWITQLAKQKLVIAYTTTQPEAINNVVWVYAEKIHLTLQGISAYVRTPWGEGEFKLPLIGQFNLSNGLAVLATLCAYGIPFQQVLSTMAQLQAVPGRMQTLGGNGKPLVVVDYAHKPDALEKVLQALRAHTNGKLICLFGCGGERDRGKRPIMANIAERLADKVLVTNDNPRHEKPEDIAAEIMQGFTHPDRVTVELDRSKAIKNSIQWASAQDCVLIAGKGAEHYQQIGDEKFPFDDVEKANEFLSGRS